MVETIHAGILISGKDAIAITNQVAMSALLSCHLSQLLQRPVCDRVIRHRYPSRPKAALHEQCQLATQKEILGFLDLPVNGAPHPPLLK